MGECMDNLLNCKKKYHLRQMQGLYDLLMGTKPYNPSLLAALPVTPTQQTPGNLLHQFNHGQIIHHFPRYRDKDSEHGRVGKEWVRRCNRRCQRLIKKKK